MSGTKVNFRPARRALETRSIATNRVGITEGAEDANAIRVIRRVLPPRLIVWRAPPFGPGSIAFGDQAPTGSCPWRVTIPVAETDKACSRRATRSLDRVGVSLLGAPQSEPFR